MTNNLELIQNVINYIEDHLTEKIDCVELARIAKLSAYEFRRVFSFIVGYAPAEYIRKRRLSISSMEIKLGAKIDENFAEKYGYNSLQSFIRAFKDHHGISPHQVALNDCNINSFNPPNFSFVIEKDADLKYTLIDFEEVTISAVKGISEIDDTVCCESVWKKFYELDAELLVRNSEDGKSYAVYQNSDKAINCHIGIKGQLIPNMVEYIIMSGKFLKFYCPISATEMQINKIYEIIRYRFIPFSPFVYDETRANLEIFPLLNGENFEILIPIKLKENQ